MASSLSDALLEQAVFCERNAASGTARVCHALTMALDANTQTGARALAWPGHFHVDAVPMRLTAPFHALYRSGRCPDLAALYQGRPADDVAVIRAALAAHDAEIATWLDGPPQTNEPQRSACFMAALLVLANRFGHPFELFEIGSSAGLNLLIDRYRYDLGGVVVGPEASPVQIKPAWRGSPPPASHVQIASVRGVDIAPIDVTDPVSAERLLSYVWADQTERLARNEAAVALLQAQPPLLKRGDAADFVDACLAEPQGAGTTRVLMHSIMWQYMTAATQDRITAAMAAAGARATAERPLAWIAFEADRTIMRHYVRLRSWPGGSDDEIATAHPHASWIEWQL